jgi:hypothetical protein
MKKIFLASAFAIAALTANIASAQAQSPVVRSDDARPIMKHEQRRDMRRAPEKHCVTKKSVRFHHGKKIVTEKRVCR